MLLCYLIHVMCYNVGKVIVMLETQEGSMLINFTSSSTSSKRTFPGSVKPTRFLYHVFVLAPVTTLNPTAERYHTCTPTLFALWKHIVRCWLYFLSKPGLYVTTVYSCVYLSCKISTTIAGSHILTTVDVLDTT